MCYFFLFLITGESHSLYASITLQEKKMNKNKKEKHEKQGKKRKFDYITKW